MARDINDSGSNGTLLNTPSIDAIQEFTLERSNYDAAFGRSGGGQIVVATKAGTNQFHGSAYEFNRNNYYNANTFGDRQASTAGGLPSSYKTPIERYNDYGFTLGGPLFIPKVFHPQRTRPSSSGPRSGARRIRPPRTTSMCQPRGNWAAPSRGS